MGLALNSICVSVFLGAALFIWYRQGSRKRSFFVSQAHLTCDPGGKNTGFNNVVSFITFSNSVPVLDLQNQILSCFIKEEMSFLRRLSIVDDMLVWEDAPSGWIPEDNVKIMYEGVKECEIEIIASSTLSSPISFEKPCWELVLFAEILDARGESSVGALFKYHHALADGSTMLERMLNRAIPANSTQSISEIMPVSRSLRNAHTSNLGWISCIASVLSLLTMRPDPAGMYRSRSLRNPDHKINVAFSSEAVCLSDVKLIAKKGEGERVSVNDVLTAIISQAFRAFQSNKSKDPPRDIRSVIWVSVPVPRTNDCGNAGLGFGYCKLPISIDNPKRCLEEVHRRLSTMKKSCQALVINRVLHLIGSIPISIGKKLAKLSADMASVSISNMAGPTAPIIWPVSSVGGQGSVKSIYFATSPPFHFGPLVSVMSYCGKFHISISARADLFSRSDLREILSEVSNAARKLLYSI